MPGGRYGRADAFKKQKERGGALGIPRIPHGGGGEGRADGEHARPFYPHSPPAPILVIRSSSPVSSRAERGTFGRHPIEVPRFARDDTLGFHGLRRLAKAPRSTKVTCYGQTS